MEGFDPGQTGSPAHVIVRYYRQCTFSGRFFYPRHTFGPLALFSPSANDWLQNPRDLFGQRQL